MGSGANQYKTTFGCFYNAQLTEQFFALTVYFGLIKNQVMGIQLSGRGHAVQVQSQVQSWTTLSRAEKSPEDLLPVSVEVTELDGPMF